MKKERSKLSIIVSGFFWILAIAGIIVIFTDYTLVKKDKEPMFCLKTEVVKTTNGNTTICTGFAYRYYSTVGNGYISKRFLPIWQKDTEEVYE